MQVMEERFEAFLENTKDAILIPIDSMETATDLNVAMDPTLSV